MNDDIAKALIRSVDALTDAITRQVHWLSEIDKALNHVDSRLTDVTNALTACQSLSTKRR